MTHLAHARLLWVYDSVVVAAPVVADADGCIARLIPSVEDIDRHSCPMSTRDATRNKREANEKTGGGG